MSAHGGGGRPGGAAVWLGAIALLLAVSHAPYLSRGLEDIDSINFAMGIRDYDPARHQPHPPGYPVYIAAGKAASAVVAAVAPETAASRVEARALAVLSLLAGLLGVPLLYRLFCSLDRRGDGAAERVPWAVVQPRALAATLLTVATPLYWYMAARPMSDLPGLAAATAAQALLALAWWRQRPSTDGDQRLSPEALAASGRMIVLGALVAGVAIGVRSQVAWMTLPLLALVLVDRIGRGVAGALLGGTVAFGTGVLLWAVPMLAATGGLGAYLAALGDQGGEDFAGVAMLYQQPSPRLLLLALQRSFVLPWEAVPLAAVVMALAAAGFLALLVRDRRSAAAVVAIGGPYAVFHLLFHDTAFVRYALPLVPVVAYLAVCGLEVVARRATPLAVVGLAAWALTIAQPVLVAYGDGEGPTAEAFTAMRAQAVNSPPGAVTGHHPFRRPFEADPPDFAPLRPITPRREWLEVRRYWTEGHRAPLWFLGDPRRTDLALIDPRALDDVTQFRWDMGSPSSVGGMRPEDVSWYRMRRPGWMLGEGWALTPETAGMAQLAGRAPHLAPITADIAHRPGAVTVMVGGRHLGAAGDPAAEFTIDLDGAVRAQWSSSAGAFLQFIEVPAGVLDGTDGFATLSIRSTPAGVPTAIEQFDLQSPGTLVWGYGEGWHEAELNPVRGEQWRWMSARADIEIRNAAGDRDLMVRGASPRPDFERASTLVVRAGDRELARWTIEAAFERTVRVPGDVLAEARGRITLETDQVFVPADRGGPPDQRALGLRILAVSVR
ncbi:MAG: DUF2723 domain-containing protein [Vicinamibacterales bacterium]|nr:DUF2723 domain-containing protein [Vicinamibacterales bacterium]